MLTYSSSGPVRLQDFLSRSGLGVEDGSTRASLFHDDPFRVKPSHLDIMNGNRNPTGVILPTDFNTPVCAFHHIVIIFLTANRTWEVLELAPKWFAVPENDLSFFVDGWPR